MKIIFHADDMGLTRSVNRGIARSFDRGVVRSTSLLATGRAFDHAVGLAKDCPGLDWGVHLCLTQEPPLTDGREIFGSGWKGPHLPPLGRLAYGLAVGRVNPAGVRREWRAQIQKVLDAGIRPTHMDSHQYVHLLPGLFPMARDLAREFGLLFTRCRLADPFTLNAGPGRFAQRLAMGLWVRGYAAGHTPTDSKAPPFVGFVHTGGRLTPERAQSILDRLQGTAAVEVVLHPGINDAETMRLYAHWGYDWDADLELAQSPELARYLVQRDFEIGSYKDL